MRRKSFEIVKRVKIEPLGMSMAGPRLTGRVKRIVNGGVAARTSLVRAVLAATTCAGLCATFAAITLTRTQADSEMNWERAAGDKVSFEAASVKENKSGSRDSSWGCRGSDGQTLSDVVGENLHIVGSGDVPLGRCVVRNAPLKFIVALAYQIPWDQMNQMIDGGPEWFSAGIGAPVRYDIDAKAEHVVTREQLFQMLQTLLADRFQLKGHTESKELQVYELMVSNNGAKLTKAPADRNCSVTDATTVPCHNFVGGFGQGLTGRSVTMADLATRLSRYAGPTVVDKTGIVGDYDVKLSDFWVPFPDAKDPGSVPTIFDAVEDQLGLKLKAAKEPVDILVIDHIEQPTPN